MRRSLVWGLALIIAVLVVANIQSHWKLASSRAELSLQAVQIDFLEAALESESTLVEASVAKLRHSLHSTKVSAIAILHEESTPAEPAAVVIWSDQKSSGQLVFLAPLESSADISGEVLTETPSIEAKLAFVATKSDRVLGITSTNTTILGHRIQISIHSAGEAKVSQQLIGNFQR